MNKTLIAASSQPLILSILANGESYGYEIIQRLNAMSGGEMEWPEATLYPVLKRLERDGYIQSQWRMSDKGRPRKYYEITDSGLEALQKERKHWSNINRIISQLCDSAADINENAPQES